MKVNYTLPGVLPETFPAEGTEAGEHAGEPFATRLQRLQIPDLTDWRSVLRLDVPADGVTTIAPPVSPDGIGPGDGISRRTWWRGMLQRHSHLMESARLEIGSEVDDQVCMQRMLTILLEAHQREEEIFARYFAEHED
jgi:hypothetical protein